MKFINKKALKFSLLLLPIGILAGILAAMVTFMSSNEETINVLLSQMSKTTYFLLTGLQVGIIYTGLLGYFGYILADKVNLIKKLSIDKKSLLVTLAIGASCGLIFIADYFTFARVIPQVAEAYTAEGSGTLSLVAAVIYGGIIEEIMLRLFFMSLISFIIWKIFERRKTTENISNWVYVAANFLSALLFAAGHLPATLATFGVLNGIIIFRCFLLNGGIGILLGWLYKKYGLQYAMTAHATAHVTAYILKHIIFSIIL